MKTAKMNRRALLLSVISLILCCAMLIGTTLAWFTDSVSSAGNKIVAGNLDIELYHKNVKDTNYSVIVPTENLFENVLWEPGHVEVEHLMIDNLGSLALKYQFQVTVAAETGSTNVAGEEFLLSDFLKFAIIDGEFTGEREAAVAAAEANAVDVNGMAWTEQGTMLAEDTAKKVTLVVWMPETVGNDANHKTAEDVKAPEVTLGLTLQATQVGHEFDSFGNDYDNGVFHGTYVADISELRASIANGGSVALFNDISISDEDGKINAFPGYSSKYPAAVQISKDTDLYLNGNDFTYIGEEDLYYLLQITDGSVVNIYGNKNSVLSSTDPAGTNAIAANRNSVVNIYGGTYTSRDVSVVDLNTGAVVNIYDGFFYADTYRNTDKQTNVLLNCTNNSNGGDFNVYGGTYVNFDPRTAQDGNYVAEGYEVITKTQNNGEVWYTVVPAEQKNSVPVHTAEDLTSANAQNIFIAEDIVAEKNTETLVYAPAGQDMTVDGNGKTITTNGVGTAAGESYDYGYVGFIPAKGEDATVNNVTVNGSGFVEVGHYGQGGGNYTINNMVIKDLVATLAINNGGNNIAGAFSHYGTATMNNCVMTGTTCKKDGFKPYDAAFVNGTKTQINGGEYGIIYLAHQAHVTITDAEVGAIDSCAITTRNLGKLTIGAGTKVGTITLNPGSYQPALVIEEGAEVGSIIYNGTTYTQAEWMAR